MNLPRLFRRTFAIHLVLTAAIAAEEAKPLAPYQPPTNNTTTLRLWGNRHMAGLAQAWAEGYRTRHPEIGFELKLLGNSTAMPALYLGLADVALFGRDTNVTDQDGFAHVLNYPPLRLEIATGSLATPGTSPALVLLVHRDNPLAQLTLPQVDAVFSSLRRRGAPVAIRTWGQLGLTGEWASQSIHIYADDTQSDTARFFQRVALGDSRRMNWEHFTEFRDLRQPGGAVIEAAQQSAAALRTDRYGLAVSNLHYLNSDVRAVPLAERDGETGYAPTTENLISRKYPLTRPIFACVNQPPGRPLDPKVREFLRYVLGAEGQQWVVRQGDFLPLNADMVQEELKKLP